LGGAEKAHKERESERRSEGEGDVEGGAGPMAAGHPRGPTNVDTVPKGVKDAAEGMGRDRGAAIGSLEEVGVTEQPIGKHGDCEIKYLDRHTSQRVPTKCDCVKPTPNSYCVIHNNSQPMPCRPCRVYPIGAEGGGMKGAGGIFQSRWLKSQGNAPRVEER